MLGSSNLIAVDVGNFSVKTLSGKWRNSSSLSAEAGDTIVVDRTGDLDKNSAVEFALRQSLKSLKVSNVEVLTAIPLSEVITREMAIEDDESSTEAAIEIELSSALPFSLDQVYFDFKKIHGTANKYLVAASRRDVVDPLTSSIRSTTKKLINVQVDVDAFAYGRLISQLFSDTLERGKAIALVDIGHKQSRFYFYGEEGLLYNRDQQIGGYQATEGVIEVYDLNEREAQEVKHTKASDGEFYKLVTVPYARSFAEQLNLVMDFYEASDKGDRVVEQIVFVGGGVCLEGFVSELGNHIEYAVSVLDLAAVWNKKIASGEDWLSFCAQHALVAALLTEGE